MRAITMPKQGSRTRKLILAAALIVAIVAVLLLRQGDDRSEIAVGEDFIEYWGAAKLNLIGSNPYGTDEMLRLQRSVGWSFPEARMMWNPPHLIPLMMPLSALPYATALMVWRWLMIIVMLACSALLWHYYGGLPRHRWICLALIACSIPTLLSVAYGQVGPLILLGICAFLVLEAQKRDAAAGAALALVAIKPQLLPILWLAVCLWVLSRRRYRIVLGLAGSIIVLLLLATLTNPNLISQYLRAATSDPVGQWTTPTLGALLRMLFGWEHFWLQFLPLLPGAIWFLSRWQTRRSSWEWRNEIGPALFLSLLFSPYAWVHDQVVLLVPIVAVVAPKITLRQLALALATYALVQFAMFLTAWSTRSLGLNLVGEMAGDQPWKVWMIPAWALWARLISSQFSVPRLSRRLLADFAVRQ